MAKSRSYLVKRSQARAIEKQKAEETIKKSESQTKRTTTKQAKGEKVSSVSGKAEYQVFIYENGKETAAIKDGKPVYRTGAQIADKMIYNKNREAWESKKQLREKASKIRKYIVRKRIK